MRLQLRIFFQTVRHVNMLEGVVVTESKAQKDELILEGNDIDNQQRSEPAGMKYLNLQDFNM